jgi:hypothetical protein
MALYALLRRIARYPFHSPFKMWSRYPGIVRAVANPSTDTRSTQSANFLTMYSGIFASCFSALLYSSICTSHIVPHAGESSSVPASNPESGKSFAKPEGLLLTSVFIVLCPQNTISGEFESSSNLQIAYCSTTLLTAFQADVDSPAALDKYSYEYPFNLCRSLIQKCC